MNEIRLSQAAELACKRALKQELAIPQDGVSLLPPGPSAAAGELIGPMQFDVRWSTAFFAQFESWVVTYRSGIYALNYGWLWMSAAIDVGHWTNYQPIVYHSPSLDWRTKVSQIAVATDSIYDPRLAWDENNHRYLIGHEPIVQVVPAQVTQTMISATFSSWRQETIT